MTSSAAADDEFDSRDFYDPDARLSAVEKLEKYLENEHSYSRQLAARSVYDTLQLVVHSADAERVIKAIVTMSEDSDNNDGSVRSELMEQMPQIALFCETHKQLFNNGLSQPFSTCLLPIILRGMRDSNNQVRKASQAAILFLLERGLLSKDEVETLLGPVVAKLANSDLCDDFRSEAASLISKMAPLAGKDITERILLQHFVHLCADIVFHIRKICAANFGDICLVVGQEQTEKNLLQSFYTLCEDSVWGVRKACTECFMHVSRVCTPGVRRNELTQLFVNLIYDQSRWVRMAAFESLGGFISTFADPSATGFYIDAEGRLEIRPVTAVAASRALSVSTNQEVNCQCQADSNEECVHEESQSQCSCSQKFCLSTLVVANRNLSPHQTQLRNDTTAVNTTNESGSLSSVHDLTLLELDGEGNIYDVPVPAENFVRKEEKFGSMQYFNSLFPELGAETCDNLDSDVSRKEGDDQEKDLKSDPSNEIADDVVDIVGKVNSVTSKFSTAIGSLLRIGEAVDSVDIESPLESIRKKFDVDLKCDELESCEHKLKAMTDDLGNANISRSSLDEDVPELIVEAVASSTVKLSMTKAEQEVVAKGSDWTSQTPCVDGIMMKSDLTPVPSVEANDCQEQDQDLILTSGTLVVDMNTTEDGSEESVSKVAMSALESFPTYKPCAAASDSTGAADTNDIGLDTAAVAPGSDWTGEIGSDWPGEPGSVEAREIGSTGMGRRVMPEELGVERLEAALDDGLPEEFLRIATRPGLEQGSPPGLAQDQLSLDNGLEGGLKDMWCRVLCHTVYLVCLEHESPASSLCLSRDSNDASLESLGCSGADSSNNNNASSRTSAQSVIPADLLDQYLSMMEPSCALTVDNEVTRHCAYSLPAVALTLGRSNWLLLQQLFFALANDAQWRVRRTLAYSLHELALIVGEEITSRDLEPIFDGFLSDLDEVRIGVIKHLGDFLRLLSVEVRRSYLGKISVLLGSDSSRNWRFREEVGRQVCMLLDLFSPIDIVAEVYSLAFALASDRVAQIRRVAVSVLSGILRRLTTVDLSPVGAAVEERAGPSERSDVSPGADRDGILRDYIARLRGELAENRQWAKRQLFVQLCACVIQEKIVSEQFFVEHLLPTLLRLRDDLVPNVRITLARTLTNQLLTPAFNWSAEVSSSSSSDHWQDLMLTQKLLQDDLDRDVRYLMATSHYTAQRVTVGGVTVQRDVAEEVMVERAMAKRVTAPRVTVEVTAEGVTAEGVTVERDVVEGVMVEEVTAEQPSVETSDKRPVNLETSTADTLTSVNADSVPETSTIADNLIDDSTTIENVIDGSTIAGDNVEDTPTMMDASVGDTPLSVAAHLGDTQSCVTADVVDSSPISEARKHDLQIPLDVETVRASVAQDQLG